MKSASQHTLVLFIFSLLFTSCLSPEEKKASDEKIEQLRQMAVTEIPVHSSFGPIDSTNSGVRNKRWTVSFFYQSPASYEHEIRDFYIKELTAKGWKKFEEDTYGSDQEGMKFRKGEYIISVYHDPTPSDSGWDYSISYTLEKS